MFLFFILGLLITAYIFNKIYFGKTSNEAIQKEIDKTKEIYHKQFSSLVPWTKYEMELLSYHVSEKTERKGFGYSFRGVFTSVYQENMMIFQRKIPFGRSTNGFTIVITKDHEILYDAKDQVYVNGEFLGIIDKEGRFLNKKLRRIFGHLAAERYMKSEIINEEDTILGSVKNPEDWELPFPRALEMYTELDPHNLITFKVLCCRKMIDIYMEHHKNK